MTVKNNPELLRTVCNTLFSLGIPAHVSGYGYLVSAITLVISDPTYLRKITKRLYPDIAKENGSTPQRVERSIRNAIEIGFNRCNVDILNDYFGSTISRSKGKTTNAEFIAIVSQKIKVGLVKQFVQI